MLTLLHYSCRCYEIRGWQAQTKLRPITAAAMKAIAVVAPEDAAGAGAGAGAGVLTTAGAGHAPSPAAQARVTPVHAVPPLAAAISTVAVRVAQSAWQSAATAAVSGRLRRS